MSKKALSRKRSLYFISKMEYVKYEEMSFPLTRKHKIALWEWHKVKKLVSEWVESHQTKCP